jgi:serine/threonine protein kinase/Flp pilus assembly protein TadD
MDSERWRQVEGLYHAALERELGERAAFLDKACQRDDELRREVESLLGQLAHGEGLLGRPIAKPLYALPAMRMAPGTKLGPYVIDKILGMGGMGVVYQACDRRLNRIVALKFLIAAGHSPGSSDAVQRFRREAEAIAALNHPAIATIFEAGEWDGSPFLSLEFLSGGTLRDKSRVTGFTLPEVLDNAAQLSSGLAFAHSKGILHRDIKPGNCMFSEHGALKLVDFGLAKPIDAETITQPGSPVGTIAYMAPELLRGEAATVRSDLYSLGAVVYEMAAGRPLYSGSGLGHLVQQVLSGSATPLSQCRPDLPAALSATVERATSVRAEDRFESVQEFADALRGTASQKTTFADFIPTLTLPPSSATVPPRLRPWRRYGAVAILLCASFLTIYSSIHRPAANSVPAETLVVLPFENLGGDPANQALCDGLQETVTSVLSSAEELRSTIMIVPSSEIRRSQIRTISEARKQFNATLVLTGSSQKDHDELELTLDLSDARLLRQKNSRILKLPAGETVGLQHQLADSLGAMLGAGPLLRQGRNLGDTTANSVAYDLFLQGRGAFEDRDYEVAAGFLKRAVEADTNFALARAKLAEAYLRLNLRTREPKWLGLADAEVAKAAAAGQTPEVVMAQALIRKATGNWQESIRLFEQVLKGDPTNVEAYRLLADTWDSAGHPKEAEKIYRHAIDLRPGYWPLYENLGDFYSRHQQYGPAEKTLTAGIGLASETPSLYSNLGAMYFRMGRWADAGKAFEKSLAIKPTAIGYANLGTVRFYEGNYADAAKQCEAATRLQPANPINWGNLGDALWQLPGERQRARTAFAKAADIAKQQLAIQEDNPSLRKNYALYLAKLGQNAEAYREARRAIAQAASDGSVHFYVARVYAVADDPDSAFAALGQSLSLGYSAREIQQEPDFNSLKKDPRYMQFVRESKTQ